jgi:hypothetical protein
MSMSMRSASNTHFFSKKMLNLLAKTLILLLLMGSVSAISSPPASAAVLTCAQGGACALGDTGPGGGIVFYYKASGFHCGSTFTNTCHYLEVAPSGWYGSLRPGQGATDPFLSWSWAPSRTNAPSSILSRLTYTDATVAPTEAIGLGYWFTKAEEELVLATSSYYTFANTPFAPNATRAYNGGGKSDWYLPVPAELNQLCKYAKGQAWGSDATICSGSGSLTLGLNSGAYYSSYPLRSNLNSDTDFWKVWGQQLGSGVVGEMQKDGEGYVRPIRAFSLPTVGSFCIDGPNGSPSTAEVGSLNVTDPSAIGTGDFTLETWVYLRGTYSYTSIIDAGGWTGAGTNGAIHLFETGQLLGGGGNATFGAGGQVSSASGPAVSYDKWFHLAISRASSVSKFFIDGVQSGTDTFDNTNLTKTTYKLGDGGFLGMNGCLAGVTLTHRALYTSNFADNLPYPTTRTVPSDAVIAIEARGDSFINKGSGSAPTQSGIVYFSSNLPISKTTPTLSWSNVTKTYGDSPFALPTPTSSTAGTWTYSSATTSVVSLLAGTATAAGAGSSLITATFTPTDTVNYNSGVTTTMTVTVDKATPVFTWGNVTKTFGNNVFTLTSPTVTGSVPGTFAYSSGTSSVISLIGTTSSATVVAPGTSTITATFTPTNTSNYISGGTSTSLVTVDKATPTFTWSGVSKNYGASAFDLVAPTPSTPGTWTYSSATQSVVSLTGISATVAGNGTSLVTATFTPTDSVNYVSGGTTSMTVTVGKPTLSVTASSHTVAYGGAIPTITYTYSGFVNGEDARVVAGTTCSTTYTTTTAVGIIGSSCTGATASNYSFTYTGGVITVIRSGQTAGLAISSTSATYGTNLSLTTTGGSGLGANSFVVDSGPCTVSGSTLTPTAAGTCYVTATKEANGNYLVASSLSAAITIGRKGLTISGLSGVNKEFDGGRIGSVTGTPTLVGIANSDDVLLGGTPTFTYASSNVANGITVTASSYTLTGTTADNYLLTQPTVTANITAKAIRVVANDVTVAFGAPVISSVTAIGLVSSDAISSAYYTYTPPGTSAVPTAVGAYSVQPSNAIFGTGSIENYLITYEPATVTILAKYTVAYNANGGLVASTSASTVDFVVGDAALTLPAANREGFSFLGWFTTETGSTQVTGDYTPTATATLWAHWIQKSLIGIGSSQKIGTITTLANVSNTYSATSQGGSVAVTYVANALAASTVIDIYQMSDSSRASSLISSANTYVLSLVIAWLTPTGTVPVLSSSNALTMLITDSAIMKGAKVYSLVGNISTLLGIATVDGSVTVKITEDPEVYIAISKPDAPTGVSATSGGNASSMVSWTAPSDGGSAITLFTAISNAGQSCTSATTSCLVTGLTNGTAYTFTVTATNTIGVSDASATSAAAAPAAPVANVSSPGAVDDSAASAAAQDKMEADKKAAELKAAAEKKAAEEAAVAAKAAKPAVTLYSVSSTLKLNAYNLAYLQKHVKSLKNGASVTCIGYSYSKKTTLKKANSLAKSQATAVCSLVKKTNKTLKTSILVYPVTKAPKAATGAKWVAVSYRVDGFGSK